MKILRNLAARLGATTAMLLPSLALAQAPEGEMWYGNAEDVPLADGIGLLLIGVLLAALAVWALRRSGGLGGRAAGMLLATGALISAALGTFNVRDAMAVGATPLDQSTGVHMVGVPEGLQLYHNVTDARLVILSVEGPDCQFQETSFNDFSGPRFQIDNGQSYPECRANLALEPGEICQTDFTCIPG